MSSDREIVLRADGLAKQYRIGRRQESYGTLRDTIADGLRAPLRKLKSLRRPKHPRSAEKPSIWALRNVGFEVKRGEVVAFIGNNGAGKSTLLKILSRITEPTRGFAEIRGRVGSLLEVGTGFHPELTGRENIFLNGAILGMPRREIARKFDEIVEFAETRTFIDTPVKHYSSGMYLRLAFAVAAHLEPEILLVDEVLAVGDAAFQKKCLGKMQDVAGEGRTVLFVSHNMAAVQSLCTRSVLLKNGTVVFDGSTGDAVRRYCASADELLSIPIAERNDRSGGDCLRFTGIEFLDGTTAVPASALVSGTPVTVRIGFHNSGTEVLRDVGFGIAFFSAEGGHLFGCLSRALGVSFDVPPGQGYTYCMFARLPFKAGRYKFNLFAEAKNQVSEPLDWLRDAGSFSVETGDYYGSGVIPAPHLPGLLVEYAWDGRHSEREVVVHDDSVPVFR